MPNLYLMCGPAGTGKSTWIRQNQTEHSRVVSRDAIRFDYLENVTGEMGVNYFDFEDKVFDEYCTEINISLDRGFDVYADATHLTPKARNRVLDRLHLDGVKIIPVVFKKPISVAIEQNSYRTGLAKVPVNAIETQYKSFKEPTINEKYKYDHIITIL